MATSTENGHTWYGLVMVGVALYLIWFSHDSGFEQGKQAGFEDGITYAAENNEELDICEYTLGEYEAALEQANSNIEDANFAIDDAKNYSGATYYEMIDALDGLEEVETVDEP